MSTDASSRPNDLALCHEIMDEQQASIDRLRRELDQVKHYVAQLLRSKYGPRSERVDPNQLELFDHDGSEETTEASDAEGDLPNDAIVVNVHRRRGGGREPLPEHLPRERVEHDLSEEAKACPGCGTIRERIGCERSEQLEFVPASLKVLEHIRWKYACRGCQEHVVVAPAPSKPVEKGLPGPGLLSAIVVSKYADHLPLYRLEDVFARHGVELARSTLCRWVLQTAEILEPLYRLMIDRV